MGSYQGFLGSEQFHQVFCLFVRVLLGVMRTIVRGLGGPKILLSGFTDFFGGSERSFRGF